MTIKLLIVDPEIGFAIPVKRALEQSGDYTVNVFANGMAAVELCQRDPQDIAILDFRIGDMDLPRLIKALRAAQPDLFILTSPRTIDDVAQQPTLDAQGSISKPYFARQLGPIITEALATKARKAQQPAPVQPPESIPEPISAAPETLPEPPVEPDDTFHRLTATGKGQAVNANAMKIEEPDIDDEATIRELVSGQSTPASGMPATIPESDVAESNVAAMALDAASDDTVMLEDIALPRFIDRLELEMGDTAASRPVPAWAEPAISSEDTQPSERLRVALLVPPITGDTEPTSTVNVPEPASELESEAPEPPDEELTESEAPAVEPNAEAFDLEDESIEPDFVTPTHIEPQAVPVSASPAPEESPVAKLAVQLTQLSVDLASDVTLVTRGETLIASAGDLPPIALAGVVDTINTTWLDSDEKASSLVRFVHVPGLGDYLLYSTPTTDDMILSMLFPAETPLKVIRKQARELMAALESVPDQAEAEADRTLVSRPTDPFPPLGLHEAIAASAEEALEPAEEASPEAPAEPPRAEGPYTAYAFVWLPRHDSLDPELASILLDWILSIATAHRWQLESTDIQPTYISVQVSIPANETPTATVEALMQETAAHAERDDLWADAYYIVAPGRAVTEQEIASFMEYRRDAVDAA